MAGALDVLNVARAHARGHVPVEHHHLHTALGVLPEENHRVVEERAAVDRGETPCLRGTVNALKGEGAVAHVLPELDRLQPPQHHCAVQHVNGGEQVGAVFLSAVGGQRADVGPGRKVVLF